VEPVLGLYREKYCDLNVRHFHEKSTAPQPKGRIATVSGNQRRHAVVRKRLKRYEDTAQKTAPNMLHLLPAAAK
jgi:hypothetical protein